MQLLDFGSADEVVHAEPTYVMRRIANFNPIVVHAQVGMVVLPMGDEREAIHECHRSVIVIELERLLDGLVVFAQYPTGQDVQESLHLVMGQSVTGTTQRYTVARSKFSELGHGILAIWHGADTGRILQ